MMPCCQLTYAKYLNEDQTVDQEALNKALERFTPEEREKFLQRGRICKCYCHIKGMEVLH